jgi:hypothetical protein
MRGNKNLWILLINLIMLLALYTNVTRVNAAQAETLLTVEPEKNTARAGDTFIIKIVVYDVEDLYAWQVNMSWNPSVLNLTSHWDGRNWIPHVYFSDFLKSVAGPEGTTETVNPRYETGSVLLGEYAGASGSGWLAAVELTVLNDKKDTVLNIDDPLTYLLDSWGFDIEFTPKNGYYLHVWPEDINVDGIVDIMDLALVGLDYGKYVAQTKNASETYTSTNPWTDPTNAFLSDDAYTYTNNDEAYQEYGGYGFDTTGWSGVAKVEVGVETKTDTDGECEIRVKVGDGTSWGAAHIYTVTWVNDTFFWIDVTADLSWTPSMINTIQVRIEYNKPGGKAAIPIYVDWLPVRVTPTPTARNPYTDVNGDGYVNIWDVMMVARKYGEYAGY